MSLYKGKIARNQSSSCRPISLVSVTGKVFAHLLQSRLEPLHDENPALTAIQFHKGKLTMDTVLALRLLSELYREFERPLVVAYVEIKAVLDSVDMNVLHWCTSFS